MRESIGKRVKLSLTAALVGTMGIVTAAPAQATELDFAPDTFDSYSLNASDWGDFDADLGGFDEYSLGDFGDTWDVSDSAYDFGLDDSLFDDNAYDFGVDLDAFSDLDEGDITIDLAEEGATDLSAYDIDPDAVSELGLDSGDFDIYDIGIDSDDLNLGTSDASIPSPPPSYHPPAMPNLAIPHVKLIKNPHDCTSFMVIGSGELGKYSAFSVAYSNHLVTQFRHTNIVDISTTCDFPDPDESKVGEAPAPSPSYSQPKWIKNLRVAGGSVVGFIVTAIAGAATVAALGGMFLGLTRTQLDLISGCFAGGLGNAVFVAIAEGKLDDWSSLHAFNGCISAAISFFALTTGYKIMNVIRNRRNHAALHEAMQIVRVNLERSVNEHALRVRLLEALPETFVDALDHFASLEDSWFNEAEAVIARQANYNTWP